MFAGIKKLAMKIVKSCVRMVSNSATILFSNGELRKGFECGIVLKHVENAIGAIGQPILHVKCSLLLWIVWQKHQLTLLGSP